MTLWPKVGTFKVTGTLIHLKLGCLIKYQNRQRFWHILGPFGKNWATLFEASGHTVQVGKNKRSVRNEVILI